MIILGLFVFDNPSWFEISEITTEKLRQRSEVICSVPNFTRNKVKNMTLTFAIMPNK